jgi:hypothetical protein
MSRVNGEAQAHRRSGDEDRVFAKRRQDWLNAVARDPRLPLLAKVVAIVLASHWNRYSDDAFPSVELICKEAGDAKLRSVQRALSALEEAGYISRKHRGRSISTLYRFKQPCAKPQDGPVRQGRTETPAAPRDEADATATVAPADGRAPEKGDTDGTLFRKGVTPERVTPERVTPEKGDTWGKKGCHSCGALTPEGTSEDGGGGGRAREGAKILSFRRRPDRDPLYVAVLVAVGLDPEGPLPPRWRAPAAEIHVCGWRGLGLSDEQILDIVAESERHARDPAGGPEAFDREMQRQAARLAAPPLQPIEMGTRHENRSTSRQSRAERKHAAWMFGAQL